MGNWKAKVRKINGKRRRVKVRTTGRGKRRKEQVRVLGRVNTTDRSKSRSHSRKGFLTKIKSNAKRTTNKVKRMIPKAPKLRQLTL